MAEHHDLTMSGSSHGRPRRTGLVEATDAGTSVLELRKDVKTKEESDKIFRKLDEDKSKSASVHEISEFVASQDELWTKISDQLRQPRAVARDAATRVAMELASNKKGQEALDAELTKDQFHKFRKQYILDPEGKKEFMQRSIFAAFDKDGSNELSEEELETFLDTLYETSSEKGPEERRSSLLQKDEMKELILKNCDEDGNKKLSFEEIQPIIRPSGTPQSLRELTKEFEDNPEYTGTPESLGASTKKGKPTLKEKPMFLKKADSAARKEKELMVVPEEDSICDWVERKVGKCCRDCVIS